jgi:DNA invertase Pin-like site-specific DNA recombinase
MKDGSKLPLTVEQRLEIRRLYGEGVTVAEIMRAVGCSRWAVERWAKTKRNVNTGARKPPGKNHRIIEGHRPRQSEIIWALRHLERNLI